MRWVSAIALVVVGIGFVTAACGTSSSGTAPGSDAGPPSDAAPATADASPRADAGTLSDGSAGMLTVAAGTGRDRFEALAPGQTAPLSIGPQGGGRMFGYHIWSAARVTGGEPMNAAVEFWFLDPVTREQRAHERRITTLMPDGSSFVIFGVAPRISDCCLVAEKEMVIRVEVKDSNGKMGSHEEQVRAGPCSSDEGINLCP
jgi:hypothetical protein